MSLLIVDPGTVTFGEQITFPTIVQLVQNFIDKTYKDLGHGPQKVAYNADSHCISYSKATLDSLFAANSASNPDGLRIYLGLHQHTPTEDADMPDRPENYIGQHTVILVCTSNGKDLLDPGNSVNVAASKKASPAAVLSGTAVEEGQICPPPYPCSTVDNSIHA